LTDITVSGCKADITYIHIKKNYAATNQAGCTNCGSDASRGLDILTGGFQAFPESIQANRLQLLIQSLSVHHLQSSYHFLLHKLPVDVASLNNLFINK
jgi:hypothetical protein